MIRVLLVDDETPARDRLKRLLSAFSDLEIVGEAGDGLSALQLVENLKPDLIFLDIEMPELDGLGVAEALQGSGPFVIFVTAFSQHALKAFEVSALDYLVKPVADLRLAQAIQKIRQQKIGGLTAKSTADLREQLRLPRRKIAVRSGSKFVALDPHQISALVADNHYVSLIVGDKEYLTEDSLELMSARMDPGLFLRVHRGAVINVDFLEALEREGDRKYVAVLKDLRRTRLPVARERLKELKARLGLQS